MTGNIEEGRQEKKAGDISVNIVENYIKMEQSIVSQLGLYYKNHQLNTGSAREDIWLQLFQMIVPKKFVIEHSVFIIDSYEHVSKEVDLAIIDNTYTPYIFQYGRLKFVPIEAAAAVVECKSSSVALSKKEEGETAGNEEDKKGATLDKWCDSIMRLRTSRESITRMVSGMMINGNMNGKPSNEPMQSSTRPIRIFCGYETHTYRNEIKEMFDFVLIADGEKEKIDISVGEKSLYGWYMDLNHYDNQEEGNKLESCKESLEGTDLEKLKVTKCSDKNEENVSLLTFNFQLNQLLMLINNPILFPHIAYARMFNKKREA